MGREMMGRIPILKWDQAGQQEWGKLKGHALFEETEIQNSFNHSFQRVTQHSVSPGELLEMQLPKTHPKTYSLQILGWSLSITVLGSLPGNSDAHAHFRLLAKLHIWGANLPHRLKTGDLCTKREKEK